jgi:hypothetical protein
MLDWPNARYMWKLGSGAAETVETASPKPKNKLTKCETFIFTLLGAKIPHQQLFSNIIFSCPIYVNSLKNLVLVT